MADDKGMTGFYDRHIFCCTNTRPPGHPRGCCAGKGAEALRNYLKARAREENIPQVRVNQAGCLDRCALGPVLVVYPEGIWYHVETREDIDEIIREHLQAGRIVTRLAVRNDQVSWPP